MSKTSNDVTVQKSADNSNATNGKDDLKKSFGPIKASIKEAAPICIGVGSAVTLLYCLRIGYLPIDGLESIATLGAAVALIAAVFLLAFILLLAVPFGVTHWGLDGEAKEALTDWFYVNQKAAHPNGVMSTKLPRARQRSYLHWEKLERWFLPGTRAGASKPSLAKVLTLTISVSFNTLLVLYLALSNTGARLSAWRHYLLIFPCYFGVVAISSYVKNGVKENFWSRRVFFRIFGVVVWGVASIYALLPVMLWPKFTGLRLDTEWLQYSFVAAAVLLLWLFYAVHLTIQLKETEKRDTPWKVTLIFCGLLALIATPAILLAPQFHDWLMERASVRMPNVQLVLKPDACATLRASGVPVEKSESAEKSDDAIIGCLLKDATVLLRVGDHWPVTVCKPKGSSYVLYKFTLPSEGIASWMQQQPKVDPPLNVGGPQKLCPG